MESQVCPESESATGGARAAPARHPIAVATIDLPGDLRAPGRAREFIHQTWRKHAGSDSLWLEYLVLIASELVTNAIKHTRSGRGGTVTVTVRIAEDYLLLVVEDDGAESSPRLPGPDDLQRFPAENGRGLALVNELSSDWGWYPLTHAPYGRVVWARVAEGPRYNPAP